MKLTLNILGGIFALVGVIWILQGIDVLPGSFMTGQVKWAIYGAMTLGVGCVLLVVARRMPRAPRDRA